MVTKMALPDIFFAGPFVQCAPSAFAANQFSWVRHVRFSFVAYLKIVFSGLFVAKTFPFRCRAVNVLKQGKEILLEPIRTEYFLVKTKSLKACD